MTLKVGPTSLEQLMIIDQCVQFKLSFAMCFTKVYPPLVNFSYQQTGFSDTVTWVSLCPWTVELICERNFIMGCFLLTVWCRQNPKKSQFGRFFGWLLFMSLSKLSITPCLTHDLTLFSKYAPFTSLSYSVRVSRSSWLG